MPPAARITDQHACPAHGPGVITTGSPDVIIGNLPAARVTDIVLCAGLPNAIVLGSPTVLINNLMAARIGDETAHGGVIITGEPTVIVGP